MVIECNIEPLTITSSKYSQYTNNGLCFSLNKLSFNWKELKNFKELNDVLSNRKIQKNYFNEENFRKPTVIKTSSNYISNAEIISMNICIPCYDEEWCELSGTLRSLSKNILIHRKRPDSTFELHVTVFIIQDGWKNASMSVKEGIVKEWGCPNDQFITKTLKQTDESVLIIIPEHEIYYPSYNTEILEEQIGICVYPIFITKSDNSQKFNSHLIFFSLCYIQKPDCVFLTDCGTLFNSDCICKLVEYIVKKHTKVIGVTARQSVMDVSTRNEITEYPYWWPKKTKNYGISKIFNHIYWWISPAPLQGFEFESTFLLSTAMFNLMGALAVLPGPCQLIWWSHLETNEKNSYGVLDLYFKHLNMNIHTSGIIKTNTLLAEDRILSFAMILRTNNIKTVWVNGATFSYEPILSWVKLLGQRRRWINGTISTYMYYLFNPKGRDELIMSGIVNNKFLFVLWYLQLYQSFLQILSPSFFSIALYESMLQTIKRYPFLKTIKFIGYNLDIIVPAFYLCFYVACILVSFFFGRKVKFFPFYNIVMEFIYTIISIINSSVSMFILYNIGISPTNGMMVGIVFYILLFVWVIPFVLSMFISISASFYYLLYSIPFLCQVAQYVSFVPTYSFARLHDLSWGNRDSKTKLNTNTQLKFLLFTIEVNIISIICNTGITMLYIYIVSRYGHNNYIYIPIFVILFLSLLIQIGFALVYLAKLLFGNICKDDDDKIYTVSTRYSEDI